MPSDNVDDSKVVEDVNILSEIISIVENTLIDSDTSIIDKVHVFSNSTSDDVDEIVEFNMPTVPSKSFEFLMLIMGLQSFMLSQLLVSYLSFLS